MPPRRARGRTAVLVSAAAVALGAAAWAFSGVSQPKPELGLLTTLPIYWAETFDIGEALDNEGEPHWARRALEEDYALLPLDTLRADNLAGVDQLLLAQPRALAPEENVALDQWVRDGGRVLVFADPFLTDESRFSIGDRRRPQDVILLSPILRRWGLDLQFDPDAADAERTVAFKGARVPVNLAGQLVATKPSAPSDCSIMAEGLVARCSVGSGVVTVVADAALLERARDPGSRPVLTQIVAGAFAD